MAPSSGTFIMEGLKLSVDLLKDFAGVIPPLGLTVVNLVQHIINIVETIQDNQEQCQLLIDRLLQLLLVVLSALKQHPAGTQGLPVIAPELEAKIGHFKDTLDRILKEVTKIHKVLTSKRKRDKMLAALLSKSYASDLKKCHDQLDWAMQAFNVASRLSDSIRLCKVSRQVHQVLTNQYLEKLPIAKYARFDCERPDKPVSCFEGTREAILKEIIQWITDPDPQAERFFWLNGLAGIGKTTIARTIAELAQGYGLLGASFLFSRRGEAELRNPALVFPTIAYQLALFDPTFSDAITCSLQAHPEAPFASLQQQLDHLIIGPLSKLQRDPERVVLVIFDAFDECESAGANTILQLLVAAIPSLPFFLKIFVTSRPESHIRSVLVPSIGQLRITALHNIEASVVRGDILVYLRASLRSLPEKKGLGLPVGWVTSAEIQLLADAAGNLFIYAATCIRFLMMALNLRRQLDFLLKIVAAHGSSDGSKPFFSLDQLYAEILHGLITPENQIEVIALLQVVLGSIVLLRNPLPIDALERLTGLQDNDATAILNSLHSVILPPAPPDHCPLIYHPSFPDFLQDPSRCTDPDLLIETQKHEARMAIHCLEILNGQLHKGMLGDPDSNLLNSEVEDLEEQVSAAFPPDLEYACRFWASHLARVLHPEDDRIQELLAIFTSLRLLPWLESMSWLGRTREAADCLEVANSWVAKSTTSSVTQNLLNDSYRLLLAHFPAITKSAQRIARSILPFAPQNTQLRATYAEYTDIKLILGNDSQWSPCLMTLKSHSHEVRSVAFSPDGARIASGCGDNHIHIHDATTGSFIMALTGHSDGVQSVAFSPDGGRIASGSHDHTVRLWDATAGRELLKLEGHADVVHSVAFSSDGNRIASGGGYGDPIIQVWSVVTGGILLSLKGHSNCVKYVKFFPDGSRIVSGSVDRTVRIWDLASRTCVTVFEHARGFAVVISPDGSRIACDLDDLSIQIWSVSNRVSVATLQGHRDPVTSIAFSPDGSRLVSGSFDASISLWDATTGNNIATVRRLPVFMLSVVFSPDGRRIVSGGDDGTVSIWDVDGLVMNPSLDSAWDFQEFERLAFSSDGTRLASLRQNGQVQVWDSADGQHISCSTPPSSVDTRGIVMYQYELEPAALVFKTLILEASSGRLIEEEETVILEVGDSSQVPYTLEGGCLLRHDVSPPITVCILPPSYHCGVTAISSAKLDGGRGDRVAIGFARGLGPLKRELLVLDVAR